MRAVVQRVREASVTVDGRVVGEIGAGLMVLLGVAQGDTVEVAVALAGKLVNLRVFADEAGLMNRSLLDTGGALLLVSQFTLLGDCRRGRRPGYSDAAAPDEAHRLYVLVADELRAAGVRVATGVFRADMDVRLVNQGPVTLLLDSRKTF
jgi:D-tyrosyl-tRNA(Tyr) deacylase